MSRVSSSDSSFDFGRRERVVVVTGGNSGIGTAMVRLFSSAGARCVVQYLAEQPHVAIEATMLHEVPGRSAAERLIAEVRAAGGDAIAVNADLAEAAASATILDKAERAYGRVDVLVNNAAHCESPDTILSVTAGTLDRHFAVNVRAPALLIQEFIARVRRRDGRWGRINQHQYGCAPSVPHASRVWREQVRLRRPHAQRRGRSGAFRHHSERDCTWPRPNWLDHSGPGGASIALDTTRSCGSASGSLPPYCS